MRRIARWAAVAIAAAAIVTFPATSSSAITGAEDVPEGSYRFAVQLSDGTSHGCTGTLLSPYWILTAKGCVSGATGPLTARIGRADLVTSPGFDRTIGRSVLNPTLDLALARVTVPVTGIAFPALGTTVPATGDDLKILGYGRTATEWVPDRLHQATTAVTATDTGTLTIVNDDGTAPTTCKGDAGGPALRETGGSVELVGVHSTSSQGGCLGSTATGRQAVETRIDVAAGWIADTIRPEPRTDFTGDGKADVAGIDVSNNMRLYVGNGAGQLSGGSLMWPTGGQWAGFHAIAAGDFTGDGTIDIAGIDVSNNMRLYVGNGAGQLSGGSLMLPTGGQWAGFHGIG